MLSWVLLGEVYPLTGMISFVDGNSTFQEKIGGKPAIEGYDSHFVLVNGFEPCGDREPTGDEIVVFREGYSQ